MQPARRLDGASEAPIQPFSTSRLRRVVDELERDLHDSKGPVPPRRPLVELLVALAYRFWRLVLFAYMVAVWAFIIRIVAMAGSTWHAPRLLTLYALAATLFIGIRFASSLAYRPCRTSGALPRIAVVIPAMNEEESIGATIDAVMAQAYPAHLLSVYVVDDGSTDRTWREIEAATVRHPRMCAMRFSCNRGKRIAMAAGIRASDADLVCFVDSDSRLEPDALIEVIRPFHRNTRVAAVTGLATVANPEASLLARMQLARYYVAFQVVKASESLFGAVTCASGCFSAYRRDRLLEILPQWQDQTFLGRRSTFGDDRSLTNLLLKHGYRVEYQSSARCVTAVPAKLGTFLKQQNRWKKSWTRESLVTIRYVWRRNPAISIPFALTVLFTLSAPVMLLRGMALQPALNGSDPMVYVMGLYAMAVVYALYYGLRTHAADWWAGLAFPFVYIGLLVWQVYWSIATVNQSGWGTRTAFDRDPADPFRIDRIIEPRLGQDRRPDLRSVEPLPTDALAAYVRTRLQVGRMAVGILALVISIAPFVLFFAENRSGNAMASDVLRLVATPPMGHVGPVERNLVRQIPLAYEDGVAVISMPLVSRLTVTGEALSPRQLADTVALLAEANVTTVTLERVAAWRRGTAKLPPNAVVLVFEADRVTLDVAQEVLDDHGMVGAVFVTGWTDSDASLTRAPESQIVRLSRSGWSIGAEASQTLPRIDVDPSGRRRAPYLAGIEWRADAGRYETFDEYRRRVRDEFAAARRIASASGGRRSVAFRWNEGTDKALAGAAAFELADINVAEARRAFPIAITWPESRAEERIALVGDELPLVGLRVTHEEEPAALYRRLVELADRS